MSVTSKNILVSFDDEGIYIYTVAGRDVKKQMFRLSQFTALGAILHFY